MRHSSCGNPAANNTPVAVTFTPNFPFSQMQTAPHSKFLSPMEEQQMHSNRNSNVKQDFSFHNGFSLNAPCSYAWNYNQFPLPRQGSWNPVTSIFLKLPAISSASDSALHKHAFPTTIVHFFWASSVSFFQPTLKLLSSFLTELQEELWHRNIHLFHQKEQLFHLVSKKRREFTGYRSVVLRTDTRTTLLSPSISLGKAYRAAHFYLKESVLGLLKVKQETAGAMCSYGRSQQNRSDGNRQRIGPVCGRATAFGCALTCQRHFVLATAHRPAF